MADHALPDDVTERLTKLMNEDNIDDAQWDEFVANCLNLFKDNPKLVELCKAIFNNIGMDWPGDSPPLLAQAAENLLSLAALRLIEPSDIVEKALQAIEQRRVRGKAALVKILQDAEKFQQHKHNPAATPDSQASAGTKACSYCKIKEVPQAALFCPECACWCQENALTCQNCQYTPKERSNCCIMCGLTRAEQLAATNARACPQCTQPGEPNSKFCAHCGSQMAPANCQKCSSALSPTDRFCTHCGSNVAQEAPAINCQKCSSALSPTDRFCLHCGAKVDQAGAPLTGTTPATLTKCPTCATCVVAGQPYCSSCACDVRHLSLSQGQAPGKTIQRVYDEARDCLVDPQHPMHKPNKLPQFWHPAPQLHDWQPENMDKLNAGEKAHIRLLHRLQGYAYGMATKREQLYIPTEQMAWGSMSDAQKLLGLIESELHVLCKVYDLKHPWKEAKRLSGYSQSIYTPEQEKSWATMIAQRKKAESKLAPGYTKDTSKGQDRDKPKAGPHDRGNKASLSEDAQKAFKSRIEQLEEAMLQRRGDGGGGRKKGGGF